MNTLIEGLSTESSVDDLSTCRGVVLSRAATILRSIETHPLTGRFVRASVLPMHLLSGNLPSILARITCYRSEFLRKRIVRYEFGRYTIGSNECGCCLIPLIQKAKFIWMINGWQPSNAMSCVAWLIYGVKTTRNVNLANLCRMVDGIQPSNVMSCIAWLIYGVKTTRNVNFANLCWMVDGTQPSKMNGYIAWWINGKIHG